MFNDHITTPPYAVPGKVKAYFLNGPYNEQCLLVTTINSEYPKVFNVPYPMVANPTHWAKYEYSKAETEAYSLGPIVHPVYLYAS